MRSATQSGQLLVSDYRNRIFICRWKYCKDIFVYIGIQESEAVKSGKGGLHACEIFSICKGRGEILKKRLSMRDTSVYASGRRAGESLNSDFGYSD